MSANWKKALSASTGSSGLMIAIMAGMKLLRFGSRCSPLGVAGLVLPLLFAKKSPLTRKFQAMAGRATDKSRSEIEQGA
jgi:hypothetical protein